VLPPEPLPPELRHRCHGCSLVTICQPEETLYQIGREQLPADGSAAPQWGWTAAGPPDNTPDGTAAASQPDQPPPLPGLDETVSFAAHVRPLFRERDHKSMSFAFDLWSYDDVRAHAAGILARLQDGSMPCDGGWPAEQVAVFKRWLDSGLQP